MLRLLTVKVLVKLFAVVVSIVIVSEAALVTKIADCTMDGAVASDQRVESCQKPSTVLMQLLVWACEMVVEIALTATANNIDQLLLLTSNKQ